MSPETFEGVFHRPVDVFAFGVLLWEVFARRQPFAGAGDLTALADLVYDAGERVPLLSTWPAELQDLVRACLRTDPKARPTLDGVLRQLRVLKGVVHTAQLPLPSPVGECKIVGVLVAADGKAAAVTAVDPLRAASVLKRHGLSGGLTPVAATTSPLADGYGVYTDGSSGAAASVGPALEQFVTLLVEDKQLPLSAAEQNRTGEDCDACQALKRMLSDKDKLIRELGDKDKLHIREMGDKDKLIRELGDQDKLHIRELGDKEVELRLLRERIQELILA
jgi:hypothetical protein